MCEPHCDEGLPDTVAGFLARTMVRKLFTHKEEQHSVHKGHLQVSGKKPRNQINAPGLIQGPSQRVTLGSTA